MRHKSANCGLGYRRPCWLPSLNLFHITCLLLLTTTGSSHESRSDGSTSRSVGTAVSPQRSSGDLVLVKIRECQPIQIDSCRNVLGYESTGIPNLAGHSNQKEADDEFKTFAPLIHINCSTELSFLLCSVYTPMCAEIYQQVIGPCRPICERVRASCGPVLEQFGFPWPSVLNCDQFPISNDVDHMCMSGYNREEDAAARSLKIFSDSSNGNNGIPNGQDNVIHHQADESQKDGIQNDLCSTKRDENGCLYIPRGREWNVVKIDEEIIADVSNLEEGSSLGECPEDVRYNPDHVIFVNRTGHCSQLCGTDWKYSEEAKHYADVIISISSSIVLLASILTLLSHQLSATTNPHTHKMLMIMILCLTISNSTLLLRSVLGRETVGCVSEAIQIPAKPLSHNTNETTIRGEPGNTSLYCTLLFAASYYFSTASTIWWLNVSFAWIMVSKRRWTSHTLATFSAVFHILAWNVPAVLTIILLIRRQFGPEELLDICQISESKVAASFILAPSATLLLLGVALLLAGFIRCKPTSLGPDIKEEAQVQTLRYQKPTANQQPSEYHQKCCDPSYKINRELSNEDRESQPNTCADQRRLEFTKIKSAAILCAACSFPLLAVVLVHLYHFIHKSDWINRWTGGSESPIAVQVIEITSIQVTSLILCLWMFCSRSVNCSFISSCFCRKDEKKTRQKKACELKDSSCARATANTSGSLLTESVLKSEAAYVRQYPVIFSDSERLNYESERLYAGANVGLMLERSGLPHPDWENNYSNFV